MQGLKEAFISDAFFHFCQPLLLFIESFFNALYDDTDKSNELYSLTRPATVMVGLWGGGYCVRLF